MHHHVHVNKMIQSTKDQHMIHPSPYKHPHHDRPSWSPSSDAPPANWQTSFLSCLHESWHLYWPNAWRTNCLSVVVDPFPLPFPCSSLSNADASNWFVDFTAPPASALSRMTLISWISLSLSKNGYVKIWCRSVNTCSLDVALPCVFLTCS